MTSTNPLIAINLLTSRRENFLELFLFFLNRIRPENKKKIRLKIICCGGPISRFDPLLKRLDGIEYTVINRFTEYLEKVEWACHQPEPYQAKLDEDIFINEHGLNFLIENVGVLDDEANLALCPLFSNGIPTTDRFIETFFPESYKDELFSGFLNTTMGQTWGVDYSPLNKHTIEASQWKAEEYYRGLASIDHYLRGIHPVRINEQVQLRINEMLLDPASIEKFIKAGPMSIIEIPAPYLCNNFFFMRTDVWRRIIEDKSLFRDPFDEVAISNYKNREGKRFLFADGAFAIHTMYNTIAGPENDKKEQGFVAEFQKKTFEKLSADNYWFQSSGLAPGDAREKAGLLYRAFARIARTGRKMLGKRS